MERMEQEGIVGQANHAGKREILVGQEEHAQVLRMQARAALIAAAGCGPRNRHSRCLANDEIRVRRSTTWMAKRAGRPELRHCCRASRWRFWRRRRPARRKACRCRSRRRSPRATARRRRRGRRPRPAPPQQQPAQPPRADLQRLSLDLQAARHLRQIRRDHRLRRQPARAGRPGQRLPDQRAPADRQFRAGRPRRRQVGRQVLPAEAGQGPLRIQPAEPDRADRRRLLGGGARPQARDPGPLSAVADAAALPAGRPHRPDARHQRDRRLCRRRVRHRGDRGEADRSAAPPADADVRRQGSAAQAMDRDRPAGLRHHRRGLQSRHQPSGPTRRCSAIDYTRHIQ